MMFIHTSRTRKALAALMAIGILGGSTAGLAGATSDHAPPHRAPPAQTAAAPEVSPTSAPAAGLGASGASKTRSTVPKALSRAEVAAEDTIGLLEKGKPAQSRAEAQLLKRLAHGKVAAELARASVPAVEIRELQARADRTAQLSAAGAPAVQVSLAANSVSQLMPDLYGRYQDPVPAAVLKLDYLDREIQLQSQAGRPAKARAAVSELAATWAKLRPAVLANGGTAVTRQYDGHVKALMAGGTPAAIQKQANGGLATVDRMETVFLK